MKPSAAIASLCLVLAGTGLSRAETCAERFAALLTDQSPRKIAVRMHNTTVMHEMAKTMTNYHYSDTNGDGMSEMIDPPDDPWSLFIGDNMYMSKDKGQSWSFMNSYDKKTYMADYMVTFKQDLAAGRDFACGEEELDGRMVETVEGTYISTASQGAEIRQKLWIDRETGLTVKSYLRSDGAGGIIETTSLIEPWPDLVLPTP